jgi:hypothetical protein
MSKLTEISIIDNPGLMKGVTSKLFQPILKNNLKYIDLSYNGNVNFHFCPSFERCVSSVKELMNIIDVTNLGEDESEEESRIFYEEKTSKIDINAGCVSIVMDSFEVNENSSDSESHESSNADICMEDSGIVGYCGGMDTEDDDPR